MKLLCKLFGHKWEPVPFTMTRDYCERCFIEKENPHGCITGNFNRSDLDESEKVIIDEDRVNDLWARCLKSNSYTHMGSEIRFDKIADMVIGENQWHMRDQALLTIKAMGKLLPPEKKLEIIKVSGVSKSEINSCYREE